MGSALAVLDVGLGLINGVGAGGEGADRPRAEPGEFCGKWCLTEKSSIKNIVSSKAHRNFLTDFSFRGASVASWLAFGASVDTVGDHLDHLG